MTDQLTILRGKEADMLLENPLLKEIWEGMEKEATEALVACSMLPNAKEDRDALIWHLKMVRKQKGAFMGMIEQGKFLQHKIDMQKAQGESVARTFFRKVSNG